MYAASANLVLTTGTGNGVNGFTLDNALGEFILTHPNVSPTDDNVDNRCASPRNAEFTLLMRGTQCTGTPQPRNTFNPSNSPNPGNRIAQGISAQWSPMSIAHSYTAVYSRILPTANRLVVNFVFCMNVSPWPNLWRKQADLRSMVRVGYWNKFPSKFTRGDLCGWAVMMK